MDKISEPLDKMDISNFFAKNDYKQGDIDKSRQLVKSQLDIGAGNLA